MILAAGLGTRLKPFTDKHPKALALVNKKTLLQHNLEYLKSANIHEVIINIHHFADQIIQFLKSNQYFGMDITLSDETNKILETGGGIKKASWYFQNQGPFLVMNVDILTTLPLENLIQNHFEFHPIVTLAVSNRESSRSLLFDDNKNLCGWKNKKTNELRMSRNSDPLSEKSFSGIHIIHPELFNYMNNDEEKFSIIDTYLEVSKTKNIKYFDHSESLLIDVGRPESIIEAEKWFY
ncbi:MAG: nucleotidyltransferase [Bacteroidetes bacterium OLB11]|nr:MAG: nucleotidyltransferase [Bacteroidetes bacterium OLB11]